MKAQRRRERRHRGVIQQLVTADPDQLSSGEPTESWTDFFTANTSIKPMGGREFFAARQVQTEVDTRIEMTYHPGVNSTMRMIYGGRAYNFVRVMDIEERRRDLEIWAKVDPLYQASAQGYLLLEDGGRLLDEDGAPVILEDQSAFPVGLETGGELLLEDGGTLLLESLE